LLEDRIQLGDTLLGLSAVALWGLGSVSLDARLAPEPGASADGWHDGRVSRQHVDGSVPAVVLLTNAGNHAVRDTASGDHTTGATAKAMTTEFGPPIDMRDDELAGPIAFHRLGGSALPFSDMLTQNLAAISSAGRAASSGVAFSPVSASPSGQPAGRSAGMAAASGQIGGGSVRIGGDFQGATGAPVDAETVTVTAASSIRADGLGTGNGGRVSVSANQSTAFDGGVSARGGPAGGSGGLIEMSGKGNLTYAGSADAGSGSGKSGTLLVDPKTITISDAPAGVFPQFDLVDPHSTAGGGFGTAVSILGNNNLVVTNPSDDFGGSKAGAVYLFDRFSGALISSLVGSHANDQVGYCGVTQLSNGNYVVPSPNWNGNRGAVTWESGSTGVSGTISDANA
jgi:hypothetical protein